MSLSSCFEYGGYHFFPVRRFTKGEGDFYDLSKRLESDPAIGLSEYKERQKYPYSYDEFYKAATNPNYDIFCCVENGKIYVPATRELFLYHNPENYRKVERKIVKNYLLIDTKNQVFDMQSIDNRRFMYNPATGVFLLGAQFPPSRKIRGSHAEDLSNAGIYSGYDDYVRGWIGTGGEYPSGVIHFAPAVNAQNLTLYNRAFDTLEMFLQNGGEPESAVRGFGKQWEQTMADIIPYAQEQKPSIHDQLKEKAAVSEPPKKQPSKKKEAEI